jgi:hypothetical protein
LVYKIIKNKNLLKHFEKHWDTCRCSDNS